jgi:hypothetical protein
MEEKTCMVCQKMRPITDVDFEVEFQKGSFVFVLALCSAECKAKFEADQRQKS